MPMKLQRMAKPLGTDKSSDADKAQSTDKSDAKVGDSDKK